MQPVWEAQNLNDASLRSRSAGSLWPNVSLRALLCRMPSIMEAWFNSSERTTQPGKRDASVLKVAQFAM